MLEVLGLSKKFGNLEAVKDVSFTVKEGEFISLLGPSGCGKTTLLRCLAGFESLDQGEIRLDGQPIHHRPANQRSL